MRLVRFWAVLVAAVVGSCASAALAQDVAGAGDHPLVGRYTGSEISFYEKRAYDEVALPNRIVPAGEDRTPEAWTMEVAGTVTSIRYDGPEGRSGLEVMRNYQQALEAGGFETILFCVRDDCTERGGISSFWDSARGIIGMPTTWDRSIYFLAGKDGVFVSMLSVETGSGAAVIPHVALTLVETDEMEADQIMLVEASAMEEAFAADGRIAVYGIYFDFDSADLRPESDAQLVELVRFLKEDPSLEVVIVGHTDSFGGFDYNLALSQRRAQAVVDALVARYGIAAARLIPAGAGMVAPASTNRTEEGRALNRRVEIVELLADDR
ncbi:OmpA family protein [Aquibaculum arenosum]|uniref:OmpA family protein n=1 Tax=Aquibaculum arenosum TaxID=3032591 RepID=A0ABT5YQ39_9PROT|nr:OmpA family protein [Fodinicurvata sp. CAU 1616]MDF2096997.1 OmpA family protein [Fodinicurvata sp. CAU 1616]